MKKYCLFLCLPLLLTFSCSKNKKMDYEKAENSVKEYVKKHIAEANTYESIAFNKIDSIQLENTEVYKKTLEERERLNTSISSLQDRLYSLEQSGVQKTDKLYTELKDRLDDEEKKMRKVDEKMENFEKREQRYVYSIEHRYKARKKNNGAVMEYNEVFYVDKDNNVIEDITYYY